MRVGIVGGGPSGLSLARFLATRPDVEVVVLEAAVRAGGNSQTARLRNTIIEFGTATTAMGSWTLHRWMRQEGIALVPLQEQRIDGRELLDYLGTGAGHPLAIQVMYYLVERYRLLVSLSGKTKQPWAVEEAAQPIRAWLQRRRLFKIELFMHRYLTGLGYGYLNQTPTVQALRWVDLNLILTGLLHQEQMPAQGWSTFWRLLGRRFDLRIDCRAVEITRGQAGCVVATEAGERLVFDQLVCAMPLDEFLFLTGPSPNEQAVVAAVKWQGLATSLVAAKGWFTDHWVDSYSPNLLPGTAPGKLLTARLEAPDPNAEGFLYMTTQVRGSYDVEDLQDMLHGEVRRQGGTITRIVETRLFKHFPRFAHDAIRDGLLGRMEQMQGENRTWYTGGTFSHDAVPNIIRFNRRLARKIVQRRAAQTLAET